MNRHRTRTVMTLGLFLTLTGCGGSLNPGQLSGQRAPENVTADFLEAVRAGDDHRVAGYLTAAARERTEAMHMVVAPPGSETANFRVCGVKSTSTEAKVSSQWSDLDTDGLMHTDEIVWLLRRESDGWRIWGMQSKVFDDQDPVMLDFENPQQMIERQQRAEEELARRDRARGLAPPDEPAARVDSRR